MNIETAAGENYQNVTLNQVQETIELLNSGNDFMILSVDDDYIQCAISGETFIVEYQDNSGYYRSEASLSRELIKNLFSAYFQGDDSWKTLTTWDFERDESSHSHSHSSGSGSGSESIMDSLKGDLSVDKILKTVKNRAKNKIQRAVKRKSGGFANRLIDKFLK